MPVYRDEDKAPFILKVEIESFMPIKDLDLTKFKDHLAYLEEVEDHINLSIYHLRTDFKILESEFKSYFYHHKEYKYPTDVARDMDAIIQLLDAMDFAHKRVCDSKKFIRKRKILIHAIALKRAKEMWEQPYEETLTQLEANEDLYDEIIECADQLTDEIPPLI